jgi:hypothetical protein
LAGFLLPFLPWLGNKVYKSSNWHYINIPLLASGGIPAGYYQVVVIAPLIVGWFFQHYLFHKNHDWWKKYNYTLAIASDVGTAVAILIITALISAGLTAPVHPFNPSTDPDYYCLDGSWK